MIPQQILNLFHRQIKQKIISLVIFWEFSDVCKIAGVFSEATTGHRDLVSVCVWLRSWKLCVPIYLYLCMFSKQIEEKTAVRRDISLWRPYQPMECQKPDFSALHYQNADCRLKTCIWVIFIEDCISPVLPLNLVYINSRLSQRSSAHNGVFYS